MARRLEGVGAEGLLICANTMHLMAKEVQAAVDIPLIHVADATAALTARAEALMRANIASLPDGTYSYDDFLDNDGVTDLHWAPGSGQINWPPIFEALRDIQYEGELSLDGSGLDIERELLDGSRFVERFLNGKA